MLQQQQTRRPTEPFVFVLANRVCDENGRMLRREILRLRFLLATEWSPRRIILNWLQGVLLRRCFLRIRRAATVIARYFRGYIIRARWAEVKVLLLFTSKIRFLPQIACLIMSQCKIRNNSRLRKYDLLPVQQFPFSEVPPRDMVNTDCIETYGEDEILEDSQDVNNVDVFTSIFA